MQDPHSGPLRVSLQVPQHHHQHHHHLSEPIVATMATPHHPPCLQVSLCLLTLTQMAAFGLSPDNACPPCLLHLRHLQLLFSFLFIVWTLGGWGTAANGTAQEQLHPTSWLKPLAMRPAMQQIMSRLERGNSALCNSALFKPCCPEKHENLFHKGLFLPNHSSLHAVISRIFRGFPLQTEKHFKQQMVSVATESELPFRSQPLS